MNNKILKITIIVLLIFALIINYAFAVENLTLEKAEDNVCEINLDNIGTFDKKIVSIDNTNKEVIMQMNLNADKLAKDAEIFLVIDNSKSMTDTALPDGTTRKDAVFNAANELAKSILTSQPSAKIGVVSFSSSSDIAKEGTIEDGKLETNLTSSLTDITNAINAIPANGLRTDITAGLEIAKNNLSAEAKNKYIILLSDGVPNLAIGIDTKYQELYSNEVINATKNKILEVTSAGIHLLGVMIDCLSIAPATGNEDNKTYTAISEEIFGTQANPKCDAIYYISDADISKTITNTIYSKIAIYANKITVVDYFPQEIIANYDFSIVGEPNIGTVTSSIDTINNSITWTIDKISLGDVATFKYKLKLKEKYNASIINQVMPTNIKVDASFVDLSGKNQTENSLVSPKIVLKGDNTVATKEIPKAGDTTLYILTILLVIAVIANFIIVFKFKKDN